MKLNLLPTTVSKGKQAKSAIVFSALIAIGGAAAAFYLVTSSSKALDDQKAETALTVGPAQEAYSKSIEADAILGGPKSVQLIKDATLAGDMIDHNDVYPKLYDSLKQYIPSFFRVNSMSAAAGLTNTATVTLVGTIKTYQQYADLMLAFSRYPHVLSVSRAGYQYDDEMVPNLTPTDQVGHPRKAGDSPVPDDKLARLAYFESQVQPQGYTGQGNFGSGTDNTRGAMPEYSLVTVTLTVPVDLTVPLPRTTLSTSGASAPSTGAPGMGGPPAGMGGPGMGGPGSGAAGISGGGVPAAPGGAGAAKKGGKKGAADDSGD